MFSLARDFPDQWYDLNNPTDPARRSVTITLRDIDFPLGVEDVTTAAVAVKLSGEALPDVTVSLHRGASGGDATTTRGVAATRRGNAPNWTALSGTSPTGDWELGFGSDAVALFSSGRLDDILLVAGWTGRAPLWTA